LAYDNYNQHKPWKYILFEIEILKWLLTLKENYVLKSKVSWNGSILFLKLATL